MLVVVLGASPDKDRYANKAIVSLLAHGHEVIPVAPNHSQIENLPVCASLNDIKSPVDTLTVYIGPKNIAKLIPDIVKLAPKRVLLNPGTESEELIAALEKHGIAYFCVCTLVLLSTNQF